MIENVTDARCSLIEPIELCGLMFALPLYRHRLFECGFHVDLPLHAQHYLPLAQLGHAPGADQIIQVVGHVSPMSKAREAMGIDWMTQNEISQAIPPAYTEHIGHYLMAEVRSRLAA